MTKFKLLLAALLTATAFLGVTGIASANGIGTGNGCTLYADNPGYSSGGVVQGHGSVVCPGAEASLTLEVCLEKNTGSGWSGGYNCVVGGPSNTSYIEGYTPGQVAGCGTWFRTWSWDRNNWTVAGVGSYSEQQTITSNANYRC